MAFILIALLVFPLSVCCGTPHIGTDLTSTSDRMVPIIPPYVCKKELPLTPTPKMGCFKSCPEDGYVGTSKVTFFNTPDPQRVNVVHCRKIKSTQSFTETWTLSEFASPRVDEPVPVTIKECRDEWNLKCKNTSCNTILPPLAPEYKYATEIVKQQTTVILDGMKDGSLILGWDTSKIIVGGTVVDYHDGVRQTNKYNVYMWEPIYTVESRICEYKPVKTIICLNFTRSLYCPGFGPVEISEQIVRLEKGKKYGAHNEIIECDGPEYVTKDGRLITYVSNKEWQLSTMNTYVPLETEEVAFLKEIGAINIAFKTRDHSECMRGCIHFDYRREHELQVYGLDPAVVSDGWIYRCEPDPTCTFSSPLTVCKGEGIVLMTCQNQKLWWNLTHPYILKEENHCKSGAEYVNYNGISVRMPYGKMVINGSGVFEVIQLNSSFNHDFMIDGLDIHGRHFVRMTESGQLEHEHNINNKEDSTSNEESYSVFSEVGRYFHWVSDALSVLDKWLAGVSHEVKVVLVLAVVMLFMWWGINFMIKVKTLVSGFRQVPRTERIDMGLTRPLEPETPTRPESRQSVESVWT